jgi:23S rRNA (adenine1618-N6)-methyltransferase
MANKKRKAPKKNLLHPNNLHLDGYDFDQLVLSCPELEQYITINPYNERKTIPFADPQAVRLLNKALLKTYYKVNYWEIPQNYLCPPIPGRADYLHYVSELLADANKNRIPKSNKVNCLDIGTGANVVYPLLGNALFQWQFVGSEVDKVAFDSAQNIITQNVSLGKEIQVKLQTSSTKMFEGIIAPEDKFDLVICNPPFHTSAAAARASNQRKVRNLKLNKKVKSDRNFGGQSNELFCEGGELQFIKNMIAESPKFATNCLWFTTLVSQKDNVSPLHDALQNVNPRQIEVIDMGQGNKRSRILAWSFLTHKQQDEWALQRWQ